jgi:hypothetical protein
VLALRGLITHFEGKAVKIFNKRKPIVIGSYQNRLPFIEAFITKEQTLLTKKDSEIWHKRLAYIEQNALKQLPNAVTGCEFTFIVKNPSEPCDICI